MQTKIVSLGVAITLVLGLVGAGLPIANTQVAVAANSSCKEVFTSKSDFLSKTGATSATGTLPNLGVVANGTQLGSVRISSATTGDEGFWVGANGNPAVTDWTPLMANELAFGYENFNLEFTQPVYSFGFDFVEPHANFGSEMWNGHNARVGTEGISDTTFTVTLLMNGQTVNSFTFNSPNDALAFNGFWSDEQFNQVQIRSSIMDDEYVGEIYTSTNSRSSQCVQKPQCSDNVDNDGDGKVDKADPGCHTDGNANNDSSYDSNDNDEKDSKIAQCKDKKDNDGDSLEDADDPGCHEDQDLTKKYNEDDDDESNGQCSDKKDNDNDGLIDRKDPDCHTDGNVNNDNSFDGSRDENKNNRAKVAAVKVVQPAAVAVTAKTGAGMIGLFTTLTGLTGLALSLRRFIK